MPHSFDPPQASLNKNRTHRYSRCWRITRTDGETFDFTEHSSSIDVRVGETAVGGALDGSIPVFITFEPSDGLDASATSQEEGFEAHNFEAQGVISSAKITEEDLRSGRFNNATVTEYLVDWRYPWAGYFERNVFLLLNISYGGTRWQADMVSKAKYSEKKVGLHWTRNCRHLFGGSGCGKNLSGNDESGNPLRTGTQSISSVQTQRKSFTVSALAGVYSDNDFNFGKVEFTNSASELYGLTAEVLDYIGATGRFYLSIPVPFDINDGITDTIIATQGCPKSRAACKNRFNNFVRYGGFPYIPGDDKVRIVPDANS
jgi:uncharacterized phage protein (TIGR02218 family)